MSAPMAVAIVRHAQHRVGTESNNQLGIELLKRKEENDLLTLLALSLLIESALSEGTGRGVSDPRLMMLLSSSSSLIISA